MKKKFLILTLISIFGVSAFCQTTEVNVYNEAVTAYQSGFYPGVVEKVDELEKKFPNSPYLNQALIIKGESLFHLSRFGDGIEVYSKLLPLYESDSDIYIRGSYFLGRCYFFNGQYVQALNCFYNSSTADYYSDSIFYSAQCFYYLADFEKAIPLYEYIIENGNQYKKEDYSLSVIRLMYCYNQNKMTDKAENLFLKMDSAQFVFEEVPQLRWDNYLNLVVKSFNKKEIIECTEYLRKLSEIYSAHPELTADPSIIDLYKAKVLMQMEKYSEAEEILVSASIEQKIKLSFYENIQDAYYSALLVCQNQLKKNDLVMKTYSKIQNPSAECDYIAASILYMNEDYKNALKILSKYDSSKPEKENIAVIELLASVYAFSGNYKESEKQYSKLAVADKLDSETKMEYAKILFLNKKYAKSFQFASESTNVHKEYLTALNQINLQNWEEAKKCILNYIKKSSSDSDFINRVYFYKGYTEYVLEDYKNAYLSFVRFENFNDSEELSYLQKAYEYGAKAALNANELKNAALQCESLIKVAANQQQKEDALIFCSNIYSDYNDIEKAVDILKPYTNEKTSFTPKALYQTAKIYGKNQNIKKAEEAYTRIFTDFPKSEYAQEAMYNCGELYYLVQDYSTAENRFNKYIYKFQNGKFTDAALYFCAECNLRVQAYDKSIMLNKTLISKYPDCVYIYGAYKNLMNAYYETQDYSDALECARYLIKNYPVQAAQEEIGKLSIEIERIISGTDSRISKKMTEYEKKGKLKTVEGRIAGSELVMLYSENSSTVKDALSLAEQLLQVQTEPQEKVYAARNAEFIADYCRKNYENKKAAQMYIKAAELYRGTTASDENDVAAVLYSAVEAFKAEGLIGDAKETSALLKKLYPQTRYATKVDSLF